MGVRALRRHSGWAFGLTTEVLLRQLAHQGPITGDQGFFFGSGPFLDLPLGFQRVVFGLEGFEEDAFDGAAGEGEGGLIGAGLVFMQTAVGVVGGAGVEPAVTASEDVEVVGHGRLYR